MNNNIFSECNNEQQLFPSPFAKELDEKTIKELDLEGRIELYNQYFTDSKYLEYYSKKNRI
jgi:hypothetical protein